ncbi:septal ring lytic transglycosylase RlpA family protein [Legionella oakridgensis]|uniref:septal ring lytic transglycosylase RlpA family protein n=1 Tax=Legionella oakridgensis TaxID=29423 RepID=UPI0003DDFB0B|nr:septal ring lytic transglycosylase RlpA family protein [Legionella oakridgensis]ETO93162.1 rare lipoprotein A [Legionella oakridgensis RV-2-2007]
MRTLLLFIIVLLASCQHQKNADNLDVVPQKKAKVNKSSNINSKKVAQKAVKEVRDGAPKGPIPTSFAEVKPATEPLSRYGNPDAYRINGQTYEVMTTSSGYRARGLASWYGTKFHRKRTSSGEDYDLYGLTAAHKTLPLPTYVKVKNLKNGREAIVKVNDRGPFHQDRLIDLSYGAAAKLGLLPEGTAPVEIEALTTNGPKGHEAHYYLQAGAFSSKQYAHTLQNKLANLTPSPVFIEPYQRYYVVKVGPFANKKMVDNLKMVLVKHGINGGFSVLQ